MCAALDSRWDANLREFARRFLDLWLRRQRADYDHTYEPKKSEAHEAANDARSGIQCLTRARAANPDQVQMMCVTIIASNAQRKHMGQQAGGI